MKNLTKVIIVLLILCAMPFNAIIAFAADAEATGTSRLANVTSSAFDFTITGNEGYATIQYVGNDGFAYAAVSVKVEKRFLLAFWNDVDEWSTTSTSQRATLGHIFALSSSGTYRATLTLEVTGTNGATEVITDVITVKN